MKKYGRTAARGFNHQWYDIYSIGYLSSWITNFSRNNDLIHFALAPIANFDLANQLMFHDSLNCEQILNISSFLYNKGLFIFPIPAKNIIKVQFSLSVKSDLSLLIMNNIGFIINNYEIPIRQPGIYEEELNVNNLPNGLYFIILKSKTQVLTRKFIIQK